MATRKISTKKNTASKASKSMPKAGKNPEGGLTATGRAYFKRKEGSNLKPGVTDAADTPEKMRRKGSFLRRHFTHPRGPMQDEKGQPTRLALSAHAWGEPVPKDDAGARKLAEEGHQLLERYHATQTKTATKKVVGKKVAIRKSVPRKASQKTAKKSRTKATK